MLNVSFQSGFVEVLADCDASISVGDWVAVGSDENEVVLASAADPETEAIGVVKSKPTTTTAKVVLCGEIGGYTGLTTRDKIFLSLAPGEFLSSPSWAPIPENYKLIQQLGTVKNETTIVVLLGQIIEVE